MLSGNPGRLSMNFWMVPFFSPAMWYLEHLFLHHHTHTEVEEVRCTGHAVRIVETATDADLTDLLVDGVGRKFLGVTSDVSEGCREGFLDTNKKNKLQNPSGNCETNLMILINRSLAHVGYCST